MGTRGHLGGLAEATLQALLVLDAAGRDLVFLETVGTGQSEIEVIGVADTVVLAHVGLGDSVQVLKAGIMEIPDVIVVNKKDHPAAKTMLNQFARFSPSTWRATGSADRPHRGSDRRGRELWEKIAPVTAPTSRRTACSTHGAARTSRARFYGRIRPREDPPGAGGADPGACRLLDEQRRELDPLTAVREIMVRVFKVEADGNSPDGSRRPRRAPADRRRRPRDAGLQLRDLLAHRRPGGLAQGREPPAHRRVQGAWARTGWAFLSDVEREAGVVAASAGNHGQAVAGGAPGRHPGADLRPTGRADGEGRGLVAPTDPS